MAKHSNLKLIWDAAEKMSAGDVAMLHNLFIAELSHHVDGAVWQIALTDAVETFKVWQRKTKPLLPENPK